MPRRPLRIFIPHSSDVLTDHLPHGDGLTATEFVRRLGERGHEMVAVTQRVDLRVPLPANVRVHVVPPKGNNAITERLDYARHLRKIYFDEVGTAPFDLLHQMNPVFAGMSLALVGVDTPLVLGTFVGRWKNDPRALTAVRGMKGKAAAAARGAVSWLHQLGASRLLLTTPAALDRVPRATRKTERIRWIGHGVDVKFFTPDAEQWSDGRMAEEQARPTVLFLANVSRRKGIFTLLEAFAKVHAAMPAARLSVAGDGEDLPAVRVRAEELGLNGSIDYLGRQAHQATRDLYRSHAVYCMPSQGEPYGSTVLEAMSCGRPLVVTDTGALPHLVQAESGHRVPQDDAEALRVALLDLLRNPEKRVAMGQHGRAYVQENHDWSRIIDRLEEIYYELLAEQSAARGARKGEAVHA